MNGWVFQPFFFFMASCKNFLFFIRITIVFHDFPLFFPCISPYKPLILLREMKGICRENQ